MNIWKHIKDDEAREAAREAAGNFHPLLDACPCCDGRGIVIIRENDAEEEWELCRMCGERQCR
jgi:hypothetical protein